MVRRVRMLQCQVCEEPSKNFTLMKYLRFRVICLRHGCLCNDRHTYWPLPRIAEALGLHINGVRNILRRWRAQNFRFPERRRQLRWCAKKLSDQELAEVCQSNDL